MTEFAKHAPDLRVLVYEVEDRMRFASGAPDESFCQGAAKSKALNPTTVDSDYDVVLTTCDILGKEGIRNPVGGITFSRCILVVFARKPKERSLRFGRTGTDYRRGLLIETDFLRVCTLMIQSDRGSALLYIQASTKPRWQAIPRPTYLKQRRSFAGNIRSP